MASWVPEPNRSPAFRSAFPRFSARFSATFPARFELSGSSLSPPGSTNRPLLLIRPPDLGIARPRILFHLGSRLGRHRFGVGHDALTVEDRPFLDHEFRSTDIAANDRL